MSSVLVTGGAGFIGSNFITNWFKTHREKIINLDKLTYASPAQLSELITIVLNENRRKTSKLGVRSNRTSNEVVSRNVLD